MNNQVVTINLIPDYSVPAIVRISQYDVERPIVFRVLDGNVPATFPSGTTATCVGTKPSGLGFHVIGTIGLGGTVTFSTFLGMTQESGMIPAEIRFTTNEYAGHPATDIGTANFILAVEPSPHTEGTTDGTQETMQNLETRLQNEIDSLDQRIDAIEGDQSIIDDIDALDARVTALEQGGSGISQTEKNLILTLFSKAAYAESDAETAYNQLESLWESSTKTITYNLSHVESSNSSTSVESGQRYTTRLTATGDYILNTVAVTMGGVDITSTAYSSGTVSIPSVTGNIVITATAVLAVQSITATYTQSGTVYDTDTLDSLKADLVVTANYSGGTSETVPASDYTLSGTLAVGTSTITVEYAGLTTTFNVVVSVYVPTPVYELPSVTTFDGTNYIDTGVVLLATDHDYSICFDVADGYGTGGSQYYIFDGSHDANNGFNFAMWRSSYWTNFGLVTASVNLIPTANASTRLKVVVTHEQGSNDVNIYWVANNASTKETNVATLNGLATNQHYISATQTLIIGAKYDKSTNFAKCTMNDFKIYDSSVLVEGAINAYLGVS